MVPNSRRDAFADGVETYSGRVWFRTFVAVLVRPWLWWTALRQWFRLVPAHWWRRAPHLPVPPRAYVRFRLETVYGPRGTLRPEDAIDYLEWCRRVERPRAPTERRYTLRTDREVTYSRGSGAFVERQLRTAVRRIVAPRRRARAEGQG